MFVLNDLLRLCMVIKFLSACLFYRQFEQDTSFFEFFSSYVSFFLRLKDVHYILEKPVVQDVPGEEVWVGGII